MNGFHVGFDSPGYLWLILLLVPPVWILSLRSLAGLGRVRWLLANLLRTAVIVMLVLALSEIQLLRTSQKVTVTYLLDQSESIPLEKREAMLEYTIQEVAQHRKSDREDRAGVIVFGRNANIEIPPFDDDILALDGADSCVNFRTDATNLEAALKLAKASFPEDSSKRIVVVTDGNENLGDARSIAASMAEDGIGIDVVPIRLEARAEVAVEKIILPTDIRRGQAVETRVVVHNYADEPVSGSVKVTRRVGRQEDLLSDQEVQLDPGKNVYSFRHEIQQPAVYTYRADFTPHNPGDDLMMRNNRATAFTHVRGKGRVLLIEDWQHPGEFEFLVARLRTNDIEVTLQSNSELYTGLAELQAYDAIILGNVPRSSGDDAQSVTSFSDQQIEMLVRNTEQMGCGLVMLGGPSSFGAGGWSNTELEKAMPVNFQIQNTKIRAVGALVLMMHASELANGNFWQKEVAQQAIKALGPMDYCGLIHWDMGGNAWLWRDEEDRGLARVGPRRNLMFKRLEHMIPGDMPEFDPGMRMSLAAFNGVNASVKLMIVISDGDPSRAKPSTVAAFRKAGIQVTTVAIGAHGRVGHQTLQDLADATGGRYYVVTNPKALPKIYVSEVRRVSRPLIYEPDPPVSPNVIHRHEILEGINGPLPAISGFVLTSVKDNPLVEVAARSPLPPEPENATVLATWTYGLGRTAVLTTDAGKRWATTWTEWQNYDKFFTQLVRWAMRPVNEQGDFSVATDVREGKVRVVVTALDKDDEFLNLLNMSAGAIDPDLDTLDVRIRQVAPGRYVGELDATKDGNYFLTINPGPGYTPLLIGVNVPYSAEYRDRETNLALLQTLAGLRPQGGERGTVIQGDLRADQLDALLETDTFRSGLAPAISSQDVWPAFLLLTACVFFADIFIRRVSIGLQWMLPLYTALRDRLARRDRGADVEGRLQQLRSRKEAISEEMDSRRNAARFEPASNGSEPPKDLEQVLEDAAKPASPAEPAAETRPTMAPDVPDEASYTERLLKAKRRAWKEREEPRN